MNVRRATIADIDQCARLDGTYETDYVWQMDEARSPDGVAVSFHRARIPRRVEVLYPRTTADLYEDWQRDECFLVAEEWGTVHGFLDMTVRRWQWQGWIEHLLVHRPFRRCGVATLLLSAAEQWARASQLLAIAIPIQPRNDPAARLLEGRGYLLAGYIDRYFHNGDPAMIYAHRL